MVTFRPPVWEVNFNTGKGVGDGPIQLPAHLPIDTYGLSIIVFQLFSWLQKGFHPSDLDTMTNTTREATPLRRAAKIVDS